MQRPLDLPPCFPACSHVSPDIGHDFLFNCEPECTLCPYTASVWYYLHNRKHSYDGTSTFLSYHTLYTVKNYFNITSLKIQHKLIQNQIGMLEATRSNDRVQTAQFTDNESI